MSPIWLSLAVVVVVGLMSAAVVVPVDFKLVMLPSRRAQRTRSRLVVVERVNMIMLTRADLVLILFLVLLRHRVVVVAGQLQEALLVDLVVVRHKAQVRGVLV